MTELVEHILPEISNIFLSGKAPNDCVSETSPSISRQMKTLRWTITILLF